MIEQTLTYLTSNVSYRGTDYKVHALTNEGLKEAKSLKLEELRKETFKQGFIESMENLWYDPNTTMKKKDFFSQIWKEISK